jgi:hypothetical protein
VNVGPATDQIAGRSRDEWNAAHAKVESYFRALHVENRFLCSDLATRVIERAIARSRAHRSDRRWNSRRTK